MATQWKHLHRKYKARRIMLLLISMFLILGLGWTLGKTYLEWTQMRVSANSPVEETDSTALLEEQPPAETAPEVASVRSVIPETVETPWELLLVNHNMPLPSDYVVEVERVTGAHYVDKRIATPLKQMIAQAKADGINLDLVAGYYSVAELEERYQSYINEELLKGLTQEEAEQNVNKILLSPENSEHATGLAVDIVAPEYTSEDLDFENSSGFAWLEEHAKEYGFILRYPKDKTEITHRDYAPWHFRYVGREVAETIWDHEYCLEEYLYLLEQPEKKAVEETEMEEETLEENELNEDYLAENDSLHNEPPVS